MLYSLLISTFIATAPMGSEPEVDTSYVRKIDMEEVTVVGFKQDDKKVAPVSVTSLDNRFLRYNDIRSIKEISGMLPNFFMPDYGSRQGAPVFVRGVGSRTNAPSVGLYIDGVPHFERSAFDIDMADVSNVEVLRGPQGTLYGRNAIGGLINVYTHSPLDYQNTRFRVSYGSRNDTQLTASTYQRLSDNVGISVMGNYTYNDGFLTNVYRNENADMAHTASFRTRLVWKPAVRWTTNLNLSYDYTRQNGFPYGLHDSKTGKTADVNYNEESKYNRNLLTLGFGANYKGERFSFNSQTAYQYFNDRMVIDQDFTPKKVFFTDTRNKQHMFTQEFTLKSEGERAYRWIVGLFAFHQKMDNQTEVSYLAQGRSTPKFFEIPTYGVSLYHQSTLDIVGGLSASLGLRFDYERAKYTQLAYVRNLRVENAPAKFDKEYNSKLNFKQFNPKFSLQYAFNDHDLLYASVTRGYKTGGFNITVTDNSNIAFDPEYNWNYEIGVKKSFWDGKLRAELAAFYIDWKDQQFSQFIPGVGNQQRNAGHSESKGVEASIFLNPCQGLTFQANYGYTYVKFLDYQKDQKTNYAGNFLPLVPRHTISLHSAYTLYKVGNLLDRLTFSAGLTGNGPFFWNETNATKQELYFILNGKISASKGRFTYELWGKNLTDTKYLSFLTNMGTGGYIAQRGRPIAIGASFIFNL